jgi:hypothetical protein
MFLLRQASGLLMRIQPQQFARRRAAVSLPAAIAPDLGSAFLKLPATNHQVRLDPANKT